MFRSSFIRTALRQQASLSGLCTRPIAMSIPKLASHSFHSSTPVAHNVIKVKSQAPAFKADAVINKEFKSISLDDYKGKWVVLFFYPLDFTFVCPTEIIAFSERSDEFRKLNAEVIGASVDSKHSHLAWINQPRKEGGLGDMKIPIVADITKQISYDYGVLIENGPDAGLALRGTFIIDPNQTVRHISVNDLGVGRSVDEVLRLLEAFQFNDEHGDVCPANWKKGGKTMIADPVKAKEYFKSVN
ncbi:hypothetical protein HDU97_001176 [Phlyctochytrium planicorne]|nr:hypothetical protein HDU97_001176 [Phlyctochytrium planicorne]